MKLPQDVNEIFGGKPPKKVNYDTRTADLVALAKIMSAKKSDNRSECVRQAVLFMANALAEGRSNGSGDTIIPSRNHNFTQIIKESQSLTLVFNDMFGWLGNHGHKAALQARIKANKRPTKIYLIHPESPVMDYVALKSNKVEKVVKTGDNRQLYDVKRALCFLLHGLPKKVGDRTTIIGHQWVHAYTMVMNEKAAYVTPYLNKKVGNNGVIHVYRAGADSPTDYMYRDILDDLEDMDRYTTSVRSKNLVTYARQHPKDMDPLLYVE